MGTGPSGKNASPAENLEIPAFRNRNAGRARLPFPGVREIYTIRQPFQCREIADNHVLSCIIHHRVSVSQTLPARNQWDVFS